MKNENWVMPSCAQGGKAVIQAQNARNMNDMIAADLVFTLTLETVNNGDNFRVDE